MAAAGCTRILFGVESDSPAVLRRVNKAGRAESLDVRAAVHGVERAGIAAILGTMAGRPRRDGRGRRGQSATHGRVRDGPRRLALAALVQRDAGQRGARARRRPKRTPLALVPGLFADLVRGHDVPAGHVPAAERALIADDAEIFAGFRVFAPPHATPRELFLLTRHAHVILEALPRTLRALAAETGRPLAGAADRRGRERPAPRDARPTATSRSC